MTVSWILSTGLLCDNMLLVADRLTVRVDRLIVLLWITGSGKTACLEELADFLCFIREISVVATKTSQSKELRVRDGVLDVCWVG